MAHPSDRKYSKEHEWVLVEGDVATVGISDFAQDQLGEVVYVDLPAAGDTLAVGDSFGEIESVKSVSELYAPVSGEIVEVNDVAGRHAGDRQRRASRRRLDGQGQGRRRRRARRAHDVAEEYDAFIVEG